MPPFSKVETIQANTKMKAADAKMTQAKIAKKCVKISSCSPIGHKQPQHLV